MASDLTPLRTGGAKKNDLDVSEIRYRKSKGCDAHDSTSRSRAMNGAVRCEKWAMRSGTIHFLSPCSRFLPSAFPRKVLPGGRCRIKIWRYTVGYLSGIGVICLPAPFGRGSLPIERIDCFKPARAENHLGPVCVYKSDDHDRVEGPLQKGNNMTAIQDTRRTRGVS